MEKAYFEFASLIDYYTLKNVPDNIKRRNYSYWIYSGQVVRANNIASQQVSANEFHSIVPTLYFNVIEGKSTPIYDSEIFAPGKAFMINELCFQIVNNCLAVCLSSIGTEQFNGFETFPGDRTSVPFKSSTIKPILDDWFNYYVKHLIITEKEIFEL